MYCYKCGAENEDQTNFCKACGAQLNGNADTQVPGVASELVTSQEQILPASLLQRFIHNIVDAFAMYIFAILVAFIGGVLFGIDIAIVLGIASFYLYFLIFEALFQKTLGKVLTGTKVVDSNGEKPAFKRVLGRSLARYIPFDAFSFLFYGNYPTKGWHDRLSHTLVVPQNLTPEQVRSIDPTLLREQKSGGLIIIILVIVFLFIFLSLISTVVLASLGAARERGEDIMITSSLSLLQTEAEFYYDENDFSYNGLCDTYVVTSKLDEVFDFDSTKYSCNATTEAYAIMGTLASEGYYCVDSLGTKGETTTQIGNKTYCPVAPLPLMDKR